MNELLNAVIILFFSQPHFAVWHCYVSDYLFFWRSSRSFKGFKKCYQESNFVFLLTYVIFLTISISVSQHEIVYRRL